MVERIRRKRVRRRNLISRDAMCLAQKRGCPKQLYRELHVLFKVGLGNARRELTRGLTDVKV